MVKLPLPRMATESPSANRERSSDDIYVVGRVRAFASGWKRAPSPDARGLRRPLPKGEVFSGEGAGIGVEARAFTRRSRTPSTSPEGRGIQSGVATD
jgi:hypothetical protein